MLNLTLDPLMFTHTYCDSVQRYLWVKVSVLSTVVCRVFGPWATRVVLTSCHLYLSWSTAVPSEAVADPGFPRCEFEMKTAWKWNKADQGGDAPPTKSANIMFITKWTRSEESKCVSAWKSSFTVRNHKSKNSWVVPFTGCECQFEMTHECIYVTFVVLSVCFHFVWTQQVLVTVVDPKNVPI